MVRQPVSLRRYSARRVESPDDSVSIWMVNGRTSLYTEMIKSTALEIPRNEIASIVDVINRTDVNKRECSNVAENVSIIGLAVVFRDIHIVKVCKMREQLFSNVFSSALKTVRWKYHVGEVELWNLIVMGMAEAGEERNGLQEFVKTWAPLHGGYNLLLLWPQKQGVAAHS